MKSIFYVLILSAISWTWPRLAISSPIATPLPTAIAKPSPSSKPTATPVPTPTPKASPIGKTTVQIPLNGNLVTILNAAKANTLYQLAAKAIYTVNGTISINQPNISINLNGSSLSLLASAGSTTNFSIHGSNFEIYNGSIAKANTFIRTYADHTYLHEITTSDNTVDQALFGDLGSTNLTLENSQIGIVNTVGVYYTADNMKILNTSLGGSYGEYCVRSEIAAQNPVLPKNALISGVTCDNRINKYNKSCIGIRMGSATIQNSIIYGYLMAGQSTSTAPGSNVPSLIINNTQFLQLHSPQISLNRGVNAVIQGNTFITDAAESSIVIDGGTLAVLKDNVRKLTSPSITPKPKFWATTSTPVPLVSESGTVIK